MLFPSSTHKTKACHALLLRQCVFHVLSSSPDTFPLIHTHNESLPCSSVTSVCVSRPFQFPECFFPHPHTKQKPTMLFCYVSMCLAFSPVNPTTLFSLLYQYNMSRFLSSSMNLFPLIPTRKTPTMLFCFVSMCLAFSPVSRTPFHSFIYKKLPCSSLCYVSVCLAFSRVLECLFPHPHKKNYHALLAVMSVCVSLSFQFHEPLFLHPHTHKTYQALLLCQYVSRFLSSSTNAFILMPTKTPTMLSVMSVCVSLSLQFYKCLSLIPTKKLPRSSS